MRRLVVQTVLVLAMLGLGASPALAGTANLGVHGASASNPLAGLPWGIYTLPWDNSVYPFYARAQGEQKQLLAKIALRPQMFNFGDWFSDSQIKSVIQQYIGNVTGGDPNVLAQMALFRLDPWEGQACPNGSWGAADQQSYRTWMDNVAAGIGAARVAVVLQPDLAFATCARSRVPLQLVSYAARLLSALPHTTVYVDGGVRYWPSFTRAVGMLEQAGIRYARGFALNTTEYDGTGAEVEYGARLVKALAAAGYRGKRLVINTAENGAPFLNGQYHGNIVNPRVCRSRSDRVCASLGIPPTPNVAARSWGLSRHDRSLAARYVDGYVWTGRPWLDNGSGPFDMQRALGLAASSPW